MGSMGHMVILVIHVFLAVAIIGLVLLQRGKGADAGAGFGSGASGTVFGARGSSTALVESDRSARDSVLCDEPRARIPRWKARRATQEPAGAYRDDTAGAGRGSARTSGDDDSRAD